MKKESKTIGLVAHDNRKRDFIEWVDWNSLVLLQHRLVCTGTTGRLRPTRPRPGGFMIEA